MDRSPTATSLARALLSLARAESTGVLGVCAPGRAAQVAVERGVPVAAAMQGDDHDPCLGDWLVKAGALDGERHLRAVEAGGPSGPVGAWLVAAGATTEPAVNDALRSQLRHRMTRLFEWPGVELSFRAGAAWVGAVRVADPVPAAELVREAVRAAVADEPLLLVRRRLGDGVLKLTPLGEELLHDGDLSPEEAAMRPLLRRGGSVDALLVAGGGSTQALRGLWALRLLGAAAPPTAGGKAYRLLLRKRRQIRMAEAAESLLDLPPGSRPEQARQALRKLARDVHPDRFAGEMHAGLQKASNEVLTALVEAEARLSGR